MVLDDARLELRVADVVMGVMEEVDRPAPGRGERQLDRDGPGRTGRARGGRRGARRESQTDRGRPGDLGNEDLEGVDACLEAQGPEGGVEGDGPARDGGAQHGRGFGPRVLDRDIDDALDRRAVPDQKRRRHGGELEPGRGRRRKHRGDQGR